MWALRSRIVSLNFRRFSTFYSKDHEWLTWNEASGIGKVGITDHAQSQLGDLVHIDLPKVDASFQSGDSIGSLESVKTVAELYAPVSGTVAAVNSQLRDSPEIVNDSPEEDGWMIEVRLSNPGELKELLSKEEYDKYVEDNN